MSSIEVPLNEDHEVVANEFCSGYTDSSGRWNNGFYCPPSEATQAQYCCGTESYKYCCTSNEQVTEDELTSLPLILGIVLGLVAAILILAVISCYLCPCCLLYKKQQAQVNGGPLYRMHCSSTASGVANMYSFSNQNSLATTPIETGGSHLLVDLEPIHSLTSTSPDSRATATVSRVHTFSREGRHRDGRQGKVDVWDNVFHTTNDL